MMMTMYGSGRASLPSSNRLACAAVEEPVVLVDVAHAFFGQQLQPALHLAHRVAQRVRRQLRLGDDGRVQVRHAFVVAQLQPLRVDQDQAHLVGRRLVQDGHDEGVDGHALARAGGARDQQVRHGVEVGGDDAAVDVLAHGQRELRLRAEKFLRLDDLAQPDGLALMVGHLDADRRLAGHALDQDALGAQGQAEVVAQAGDAAVLDAGLGLELEGGDDGAGIDLHHLAADVELGALFRQHLRQVLQLYFVDGAVLVGTVQQRGRRQLVAAGQARHGGLAARRGVGAGGDCDGFGGLLLGWRWLRALALLSPSNVRSMPVLAAATIVAMARKRAAGCGFAAARRFFRCDAAAPVAP